jgi:hypothetical protein
MAGIAQNVELFNLAYNLAWKHISEHQKRKQPKAQLMIPAGAFSFTSETPKNVDERS